MIYRLPEIEDKEILNDYVQEHFALGEIIRILRVWKNGSDKL